MDGSPFLPPQCPNTNPLSSSPPPPPAQQPSSRPRAVQSSENNLRGEKSDTATTVKKKKKIGSSYHFIPMMGRHRHGRRGGGSDSESSDDDGYHGDLVANSSVNNNGKTKNYGNKEVDSNLSDQDALRDIFTNINGPLNNGATSDANDAPKKIFIGETWGDEGCGKDKLNMTRPLHLEAGASNADLNDRSRAERQSKGKEEPFTSRLGQRIWRKNQNQQQEEHQQKIGQSTKMQHYGAQVNQSKNPQQQLQNPQHLPPPKNHQQLNENIVSSSSSFVLPYQHLPPPDFLRLPPTMVQIRLSSSNTMEWVNTEELERRVLQHHLDSEALESANEGVLTKDEHDNATYDNITPSLSSSSLLTSESFTRAIERDSRVGLGMSLREYDGCVYIQKLLRLDGSRLEDEDGLREGDGNNAAAGPAFRAGLLPGDRLLGLNGHPFLKGRLVSTHDVALVAASKGNSNVSQSQKQNSALSKEAEEVLKSVADAISNAKSPMALHIQRESDREHILALLSKLRTDLNEKNVSITKSPPRQTTTSKANKSNAITKPKRPIIHPFAKALVERNLIKKGKEEHVVTRQLRIFTDRTRQWESKLSFRLRASDSTLRPVLDARDVEPSYFTSFLTDDGECPPFFDYKFSKSIRSYAPSTPMIRDWRLSSPQGEMVSPPARRVTQQMSREAAIMADLYSGLDKEDAGVQDLILGGRSSASNGKGVAYPASVMQAISEPNDIFVPLVGIRKAICVRILNSFLDNRNRVAFTIWCYDVESGMEWYAPVRYYNDFKDLRLALLRVDKTIGEIPFPSLGWSLGFSSEAKESAKSKEARRSQLETFLRRVFAGLYRGRLHPYLAEVAVHLQTFVGCDMVLGKGDDSSLSLSKQVATSESSYGKRTPNPQSEPNNNARMHLKRSIQRYVYRLFLLPSIEQLVSQFVDAAMEKVMNQAVGPTKRQSHKFSVRKGEATEDVEKIRDFIDQVQELFLDGCHDDFVSMSQRRDFAALVDDTDNSIRDNLFREAVREQTELEVYVPLRSTISKYLVYAWFNEDTEIKHKMKALVDKPQSYFRIPKQHRSRSDWKSVSRILQEGVGRSTLPCVKLRAVVDAAKEISQLDSEERSVFPDASFFDGKVDAVRSIALGADDFLPIFIFCFVQAKIERPSAVCELLSVMCDPRKMSGETGYYLASFHAALTHIHQLDLTEAENDLSIIFDT